MLSRRFEAILDTPAAERAAAWRAGFIRLVLDEFGNAAPGCMVRHMPGLGAYLAERRADGIDDHEYEAAEALTGGPPEPAAAGLRRLPDRRAGR